MVALFFALLQASCTVTPTVPEGNTVEDFARALKGKLYGFAPAALLPRTSSDADDPVYGYEGLALALQPIAKHCLAAGARIKAIEHDTQSMRRVPTLLACQSVSHSTPSWYFRLAYLQEPDGQGVTVRILDARALNEQQLQDDRRVAEERRLKQKEATSRYEAALKKSAKALAEWEARQRAALEGDLADFRAGLKQGHLIRWLIRAPEDFAVGMVVRIEGDLALVQFNNAVIGGSNTRYVRRAELLPWNGRPTGNSYSVP